MPYIYRPCYSGIHKGGLVALYLSTLLCRYPDDDLEHPGEEEEEEEEETTTSSSSSEIPLGEEIPEEEKVTPLPSSSSALTSNLLKSDQLLTTHRSPSTVNRPSTLPLTLPNPNPDPPQPQPPNPNSNPRPTFNPTTLQP